MKCSHVLFAYRESQQSSTRESPERTAVKKDHEDHLHSFEKFYSELRLDTEVSKKNDYVRTITFDFQQNLQLLHIPVGDLFYMHQLWLYIFGIHSCKDNDVAMFCWTETVARRSSDEVISCLHSYLTRSHFCTSPL